MRPDGRAAVTFDLWYTLVRLDAHAQDRYLARQIELAVEALSSAPREPGARTDHPGREELRRAVEEQRRAAGPAAEEGRTLNVTQQLDRAGRALGLRPSPQDYLHALDQEVRSLPFATAPGAEKVLEQLHEEGYRLGVVSNTVGERGSALRAVLEVLRLSSFLDTTVFSDELPWTKPEPRIFQRALDILEVGPDRVLHVGDGWSDLEGARRAGLRGAVLFTGLRAYSSGYRSLLPAGDQVSLHADHEVERFSEVPALVHALLPLNDGR